MRNSLIKILCWIGLLFIMVVIVPAYQANKEVCSGRGAAFISGLNDSSHTVFFIGSSRTKAAVNDELISSGLNGWKAINLGIASSTITQHFVLAEHISRQKGEKILFVELSGFWKEHSSNVAVSHFLLKVPAGTMNYYHSVDSIVGSENSFFPSFPNIQKSVFNAFKIAQVSLKSILGVHPRCEDHFGYKPLGHLKDSGPRPLLRPNHFQQYANSELHPQIEQYIQAFRNLEKRSSGLRVIFLLPFTSYRELERQSMIPSYLRLDDNEKVVYSPELYSQIKDSTMLADNNHLNKKGAEVYTAFFLDYLKNYLVDITEERKLY